VAIIFLGIFSVQVKMEASSSVQTQHSDCIHDAQLDYYGARLATCSSDKLVKIFEVADRSHVADLKGHDAPVWQVAWAHPKFGTYLASCSYDRRVLIWRETSKNVWQIAYTHAAHEFSVNSVSWAPHEYGLALACASSDGSVSILSLRDGGRWESVRFSAHSVGCNTVSWAPRGDVKKLATGGCDEKVKLWRLTEGGWTCYAELKGHRDWVRDVAWAPSVGLPTLTLASGGQDRRVCLWVMEEGKEAGVQPIVLQPEFPDVVWRVSWSVAGNVLAVASGDHKVTLWRESLDGDGWKCISSLDEHTASQQSQQ